MWALNELLVIPNDNYLGSVQVSKHKLCYAPKLCFKISKNNFKCIINVFYVSFIICVISFFSSFTLMVSMASGYFIKKKQCGIIILFSFSISSVTVKLLNIFKIICFYLSYIFLIHKNF